ncbi:MAG: hypothetical protein ABEJ68_00755 [Halobacteriaceae archaeon]
MSRRTAADIARRLTGLCTYLVQGPEFEAGDAVYLILEHDGSGVEDVSWLPLTAVDGEESRERLTGTERRWADEVVLVRARLAATGGQPRDSMNQPADDYDPEALTLSDVTVVDRSVGPP